MKVTIKNFNVQMEIKNTGIELEIRSPDGNTQLGDLVITKSGVTWCKGRTTPANGIRKTWKEFIAWAEDAT